MKELYELTHIIYRLETTKGNKEEFISCIFTDKEIRYGFSPKNKVSKFETWEELPNSFGKYTYEKGKLKGQEFCHVSPLGDILKEDFISLEIEEVYSTYKKENYPSFEQLSKRMKFWEFMELIKDAQKNI